MFFFAQTTDMSNSYFDFKISWHTDAQRDQEKIIDQHDKIWKGTKNCFGNKVAHQWCVTGVKKKKIMKMEKIKILPFCSLSLTSF